MDQNYPKAENPNDPSSYFLQQDDDLQKTVQKQRLKDVLLVVRYYAIKVWPFVQRTIQGIVYFIIGLIRSLVKLSIEQIKNFKGS